MREETVAGTARIPVDQVSYLITTASRAPSVHNTQPWRFWVRDDAIELLADPRRRLRTDRDGREMLISCGAALFGLRLAVRSLGDAPVVGLLPEPSRLRLLARVTLGPGAPMTAAERQMLDALPHRHTHRGPFAPDPLPGGLLAGLQHDALAERADLALVERGLIYQRLADVVAAAGRRQALNRREQAEIVRWSRAPDDPARDGVPALAFPAAPGRPPGRPPGRLPQRDFDLGRGLGLLPTGGPPPAATAILLTAGDTRADWLHAGQALHRLLLHAAGKWVFASLHTQPLESAAIRGLIRDELALPGIPQVMLQFGVARTTYPTARRAWTDVIEQSP